MKTKVLLFLFFIGTFIQSKAQVNTAWVNQPGGVSIATDAVNNVYTANWDYNPAGDITLTKRNSAGNIIWQVAYDNTDQARHEVATWVETDHFGNIIVSGTIRSGFSNPVNAASLLMKYDPSGKLLWRVVYESSFDGSYTKKCIVDADNNIYVLGMGSGTAGYVTKVKKFAPDGSVLWAYYDEAGIGAPLNFKFTPDNKIVIVGRGIIGSVNGYAKIDLNGNNIWSYPGVFSLYTGDAAGDVSGNTYITHQEYVFNGRGEIKKLSPAGSLVWERFHTMVGYRVEVGRDNNAVISGFPNEGTTGAAFMKYDGNGNVVWQNMDADGAAFALMLHAQMKMDAADNAYLAAGTLFDMAVCKVNKDGSAAWTQAAPGGFAYGLSLGADNNVYVVGGNTAKFVQPSLQSCNTPDSLFANNIGATKVRLNWKAVIGAAQYELWGRAVNTTTWRKSVVPAGKNFLSVPGLSCGTKYEWKIRTICDSTHKSVFSALQSFTTAACITNAVAATDAVTVKGNDINIYPNPVRRGGTITVNGITTNRSFILYDAAGRQIANGNISANSIPISSHIMPGIYLLEIHTNGRVLKNKIVIE